MNSSQLMPHEYAMPGVEDEPLGTKSDVIPPTAPPALPVLPALPPKCRIKMKCIFVIVD